MNIQNSKLSGYIINSFALQVCFPRLIILFLIPGDKDGLDPHNAGMEKEHVHELNIIQLPPHTLGRKSSFSFRELLLSLVL